MRVFFDTSVLVELERRNKSVLELVKKLVEKEHEIWVSTITVSELMLGALLCRDVRQASLAVREVLGQFQWRGVDGVVAEKTAQLLAYLVLEKRSVEFQDVVIAASSLVVHADVLLTLNKKDFVFPHLKGQVFSPVEFRF